MARSGGVSKRPRLEVQRLNLVEKLAEELKGKNSQLENAMDDCAGSDQLVDARQAGGTRPTHGRRRHEITDFRSTSSELLEVSEELMENWGRSLPTTQESLSKTTG